jgi:sialic acid synthase SpsE
MHKTKAARSETLRREYRRLSRSLAAIGYISQGSVLDRSTLRHARSGYQWTRKMAQKTITVALSPDQFRSLKKAIANRRALQKTIDRMEKLSRQILFESLPDTSRRKPLAKRVLGTI